MINKEEKRKKQFDVIVMNPPYQNEGRKRGGVCASLTLWDKFVLLAHSLTKDRGNICAVHPSLWRKPGSDVGAVLLNESQIHYLEIHNEMDGMRTFGAETRYDWYVATKGKNGNSTIIKGQDGKTIKIDLSKTPFIPNSAFSLVKKLLAQDGEDKVQILHSYSDYETRKPWMSKEKKGKFRHPCIYTVPKSGKPNLMWSSKKSNGHFEIPKVVYSTGRPISVGIFIDKKGEYGLTQFSSGIVAAPKNLSKIARALDSKKFRELCASLSIGKLEINTNVLALFRRDFWKEFI